MLLFSVFFPLVFFFFEKGKKLSLLLFLLFLQELMLHDAKGFQKTKEEKKENMQSKTFVALSFSQSGVQNICIIVSKV